MERPAMNAARVAKCVKSGRTRADCMKEIYPGKSGGKKGKSKKPPARPPRGSRY